MKREGGGGSAAALAPADRHPCSAYVLRRLAATIPVMLIVAVLVFLMLRLTPSDPAAIIAGDNANSEQVAEIRKRLGLDQPILTQFVIWTARPCKATSASPSSSRSR